MTHFTLHIGLHKTGSSTIQAFLSKFHDELLERGIDYPLAGRTATGTQAHRHVAAWFRSQKAEYPPEFVHVMRQGLSHSARCIISAEDLYFCKPEHVDKVAAAFPQESHVICYLRDPVEHVNSMWKEGLKRGSIVSFRDFLGRHQHELETDSSKSYYAIERNLGYWKQFFRVTAATYLRVGLVSDFVARCEIDLPREYLREEPRENQSPCNDAMILHVAIRRALENGLISKGEWHRLRASIASAEKDGRLPGAGDHVRWIDVSFKEFLTLFRTANPAYREIADRSRETATIWEPQTVDHVALLRILRDAFPASFIRAS